MSTKKRVYGWVVEMKKNNCRYPGFYGSSDRYSGPLRFAYVISSRDEARGLVFLGEEIVRKVELTKTGKAKKIIPGR